MTFEESIKLVGEETLQMIGIVSASEYMTSASQAVTGKPRIVTGGLRDSILGGKGAIRKSEITDSSATFTIGTTLPYAALIAKGGVRVVTDPMRRFYKFKFFSALKAGDSNAAGWLALRFRNLIRYLPRPFLEPAAEDVIREELPKILNKYTMQYLKTAVEEIIVGTPRAVPLNAIKSGAF